ncbi:MAG: MaoC/PaaZ C-terminal domain-containing protein [Sorangiineae bacterium]|nr:MaoC/PaaZ C-terminal domain-containing protein [Polyangiaceae bacterium]MEB2323301.1 MaoC/PaaZ C-terminal domain-containing protein [Sorangiineae bacterium]
MSLDPSAAGYKTEPYEFKYDWKTVVLYALGIGARKDELDYLYESRGPKVFPTFAVVPALAAVADMLGKTRCDLAMVVHGSQGVRLHRPIPSEGTMQTTGEVTGLYDMKKMAQVTLTTRTEIDGKPVFDTEWGILVRGAGGFGGEPPPKADVPAVPERAADFTREAATSPEQALLYRLSGDLNPLHADPGFAAMVGFPQGPILHGLCTYGFVARAVIAEACGGDANRLTQFHAQFRKPVWPGETIRTEGWKLDGGRLALRAFAADRPDAVITNSWAEISGSAGGGNG